MILLNSRYAKNDHKLMADMQVFKIIRHSSFFKKAVANQLFMFLLIYYS